jgi:MFS family permease
LIFVLGAVAFGLGAGLYAPPRVTVLSRIYPNRDGTALGMTFALGNFGAAALPVLAGALAIWAGWRYGFGVMVVPLGLCALGLWQFAPAGRSEAVVAAADPPRTVARRVVAGLRDRTVAHAWLAMTLMLFTYQGLEAFLPTYLVAVKGLDPGTAATLFGLYFASGAITQPFAGSAAETIGGVALPVVESFGALLVVITLLGTRLGNGPVGNGYVARVLPEAIKGSGFGLFRTIYMAVGALGSTFVGVLAGLGYFDVAFLALAGITALAALGYYLLPDLDGDESGRDDAARSRSDPASSSRAVEPGSDTGEKADDVTD